jgi:alpha-glucoside transport system substrate-binding protein
VKIKKGRIAAIAVAILVVAGIGAVAARSGSAAQKTPASLSVSGSVKFWGIWSAEEQSAFEKVIAGFNKQYPNVKVSYSSKGNDIPTVLATAIAGGNPPDVADVAQPGLVKQFV